MPNQSDVVFCCITLISKHESGLWIYTYKKYVLVFAIARKDVLINLQKRTEKRESSINSFF